MCHIVFIHTSAGGEMSCLSCFHLALVNNASLVTGMQTELQDPVFSFFGYFCQSEIAGSCDEAAGFLKNGHTVLSSGLYHQTFIPVMHKGSGFLYILTNTCSVVCLVTALMVGLRVEQ